MSPTSSERRGGGQHRWNAEDGKDHTNEHEEYGFQIWTEDQVGTLMKGAGFMDVVITYRKAVGMPRMVLVRAVE